MWRLTPSNARSPPKFLRTPSMSTAKASAIGNSLMIRSHRAQPVVRQQNNCLFAVNVKSRDPLSQRSGQQVKEDRTDERLQRQQGMHHTQPARRHLSHHVSANRAEDRRDQVA